MMGSICHLIGTTFDLLNPNFDKFIHFQNFDQNLGLKGQKLSKFEKNQSLNRNRYFGRKLTIFFLMLTFQTQL